MVPAGEKLPLPLEGIRVLDATHIVAGPFCSMILADMGAEVIKIERPHTGDLARSRGPFIKAEDGREMSSRFLGVNRNKKSVSIDLRNPRCKTAFEELVRNSDVLVDNWGSGAFRRLGLGYDRLSEINPGLVYASITGYGDSEGLSGPYSDWPANNLSIQAMSGWMEITGDPDGPPQSVGDNIGDSIPGVWTALGIVLALETKRKTGKGQYVDMAMYECMVSHIESNMNSFQATGANPGRSRESVWPPRASPSAPRTATWCWPEYGLRNGCASCGRWWAGRTYWKATPGILLDRAWTASSTRTTSFRPSKGGRPRSLNSRWRRH